jgi:hypothetical protein
MSATVRGVGAASLPKERVEVLGGAEEGVHRPLRVRRGRVVPPGDQQLGRGEDRDQELGVDRHELSVGQGLAEGREVIELRGVVPVTHDDERARAPGA